MHKPKLYLFTVCLVCFIAWQMPVNCFAFAKPSIRLTGSTADVFIKISPSKTTVYKGEPITVKYLLYYAKTITDPQNDIDIKFKNCYTEEYPVNAPVPDERVNSKLYHVVQLKKFMLIPQTEGPLKIPSLSIKLKMTVAANDFFGGDKTVTQIINAKAIAVMVIPLPVYTDSTQFSGAVGKFDISTVFEPSPKFPNLMLIHLNIAGMGNLKFAWLATPDFPAGIDPSTMPNAEKDTLTETGLSARYTFSFQLISNYRGSFALAPVTFIYFDPDAGRYVKYKSPAYSWNVTTGPPLPKSLPKINHGIRINADPILYTKTHIGKSSENRLFFRSALFYFTIFISGLLYLLGFLIARQRKRRLENLARYNFKIAKRRAFKSIKRLRLSSKEHTQDAFNKKLSEILQLYLCGKYLMPHYDFSATKLCADKTHARLPANLQDEITDFLKEQDNVRFSPNGEFKEGRKLQCLYLMKLVKDVDNYLK